jgi:2-polyprenyl-6-methoxyphenol hydroxylase-like FAD-dependent oxidoreductase
MKSAIIVGGSMGGLLIGNMLFRQGWTIKILERSKEGLQARGAGIVPQRSLLTALRRAGVIVRPNIGIHIAKRVAYDQSGNVLATHPYEQYATSWSLLYNLLIEQHPKENFHAGCNVTAVMQDSHSAGVILDDGTRFKADLVIGADGMRSTVRGILFPDVQPRYVGYLAWRGMLEERHATPEFVDACFSALNFSFPDGEEVIGYPVAGNNGSVEVGQRRFNIMWYRPVAPGVELRQMFTSANGVHYATGIPPSLVRPELVGAMKRDARSLLPLLFSNVIERMEGMFVQAIYDLESNRMGAGKIALIGDAAFVARPHCGAGVSKAADDAASLADSLGRYDRIDDAIDAFSSERTPAGKAAVKWAARLGSYFQKDTRTDRTIHFEASRSPVDPAFIIKYTGIELSEVTEEIV